MKRPLVVLRYPLLPRRADGFFVSYTNVGDDDDD
jgi:hypothetical protein